MVNSFKHISIGSCLGYHFALKKYAIDLTEVENAVHKKKKNSYFIYENKILYRIFISKSGDEQRQIVVPVKFTWNSSS